MSKNFGLTSIVNFISRIFLKVWTKLENHKKYRQNGLVVLLWTVTRPALGDVDYNKSMYYLLKLVDLCVRLSTFHKCITVLPSKDRLNINIKSDKSR